MLYNNDITRWRLRCERRVIRTSTLFKVRRRCVLVYGAWTNTCDVFVNYNVNERCNMEDVTVVRFLLRAYGGTVVFFL